MEPQIINYYNHKNVLCKICSRIGHTSGSFPNVGMAKIGTKEKKEDKVDGLVFNVTSFSPQKKRGMEPQKKESKGGEINYPTDDFLMNDKPKKKRGRKPKKDKDDDPISSIIFTDSDDEFIIDEDYKRIIRPTREIEQEDIDMVVNYTGVERDVAEEVIQENGGDPVLAIMKLPLKDSIKKDISYPNLSEGDGGILTKKTTYLYDLLERDFIPTEVYSNIISQLKKHKSNIDMNDLSYKTIREILKQLRYKKYYVHIPHIINMLNGKKAPIPKEPIFFP